MTVNTIVTTDNRLPLDDKPIWHRATRKTKKPAKSKFPPDRDIDLWLKHNAPLTYEQLADIRYTLYHRCSRADFVVTKRCDDEFTLTGRRSSLRVISDRARHYLLWKLRLLGRENGWQGALPRTRRPRTNASAK